MARPARIIVYDGRAHTITEWAAIINIPRQTLAKRLRSGWSIQDALTIPLLRKKPGQAPLQKPDTFNPLMRE